MSDCLIGSQACNPISDKIMNEAERTSAFCWKPISSVQPADVIIAECSAKLHICDNGFHLESFSSVSTTTIQQQSTCSADIGFNTR